MRLVPEVSYRFLVYDQFKIMFTPTTGDSKPGFAGRLASGGLAGLTAQLLFYPLDLARTRITCDRTPQGQPRECRSLGRCLVATYHQGGIRRGLYR